ncbi:MAG: TonB-dependent receptor [Gammaproteobacteria bacterium]
MRTGNKSVGFNRTRCARAVAAVVSLMAAEAALAQQTGGAAPAAAGAPSVVVVSGTRASVASSIDRKKGAATVTDSIVAEDIGEFPDKNVGEALSRVTGVQLTRDFGEGSRVSIRGVEPDLNRIEINGMSVLGTDGGSGRGAELRELASELIKSIDVYKGVTADMTEGGVGGTVVVTTRKPLDFNKFTIATTLAGEHSTSRGGVQPRGSLLIADRFFGGDLGLMANLVYDKVLTQNDYARNTSWRFLRDWDFSPERTVVSRDAAVAAVTDKAACGSSGLTAAQVTACQNQWNDYSPNIPRYGIWTRDHKRSSAELTAQYKFSDNFNAYISRTQNTQDETLNDRNFATDLSATTRLSRAGTAPEYNAATAIPSKAGTCIAAPANATPAGVTVQNHHVVDYTVGDCTYVSGVGGQGAFSTSARDFNLKVESIYNQAGFSFRQGQLDLTGMAVKSKSTYSNQSNNIILTQNAPGLRVTMDEQSVPHFTFPAGYDPENSASYNQITMQYRPSETKNTEDQLKLDAKYRLTTPFFTKIHVGAQGMKTSSRGFTAGGYMASAGADPVSTADDVNVLTANVTQNIFWDPNYRGSVQRAPDPQGYMNQNNFSKYVSQAQMVAMVDAIRGRSPGTFFNGYDGVGNIPASWMSPIYANATQFFDTSHFNFDNLYQAMGSDGKVYPQIPFFDNRERIKSAYLRLDFEQELFGKTIEGNVGVRYTHTHDVSSGLFKNQVRVPTSPGSSAYADRVISNSTVALENTYHDLLPSFNAATWLMPDTLVARVGWAKVMARPKIADMVPNATCTLNSGLAQFGGDGTDDCTAGNPALEPFRATNKDLSFEYYPDKESQVSVALFRKDITSFILAKQLRRGVDLFGNGQLWDVNQPINGRGATTKGVEITGRTALTFLPGWLGGFGVDANYTRMSYKYAAGLEQINSLDGTVLPYPGLSKNSYNIGIWYDRDKFNARLAYNYRDAYYTGTTDVSGNPNFGEKTGFLDGKFQYRYNDHITFAIEGKNLTDEVQITTAGDPFRLNELAWSGRRYYFTVSIKN